MNITIKDEVKEWYKEIANDLKVFYIRTGIRLTERELFIAIERRFGTRILKEICIPHNLNQGECLIIAMAVAKEAA